MKPPAPTSNEVPVMVKAGCTAYFHIPPAWMGSAPSKLECESAAPSYFTQVVYEKSIVHGIVARVQRDGVVMFDCRKWADAGETEFPGYTATPHKFIPQEVTEAENLAEMRALKRVQIINAHQACLCSALYQVRRRGQGTGALVLPFQAYHVYRPTDPIPRWDHDVVQHFANHLTNYGSIAVRRSQQFQMRSVYETDVLVRSFELLEEIMRHPIGDLLDLTELLYRSGAQYSLNSFQESLILSWGVCEKLLLIVWTNYLEEQNRPSVRSTPRINKERRKKLTGRDFTASIISETLELAGRLTPELFERLGAARKARNDWMHGLKPVDESDATGSLRAAMELYESVAKIRLTLNFSRYGGSGGAIPKSQLEAKDRHRL